MFTIIAINVFGLKSPRDIRNIRKITNNNIVVTH